MGRQLDWYRLDENGSGKDSLKDEIRNLGKKRGKNYLINIIVVN